MKGSDVDQDVVKIVISAHFASYEGSKYGSLCPPKTVCLSLSQLANPNADVQSLLEPLKLTLTPEMYQPQRHDYKLVLVEYQITRNVPNPFVGPFSPQSTIEEGNTPRQWISLP